VSINVSVMADDLALELVGSGDGYELMSVLESCAFFVGRKYATDEPFERRCDVFLERTKWRLNRETVVLLEKIVARSRT
jgi:hypothetical protein